MTLPGRDRDAPRWNDSWGVDVMGTLSKGLALFPGRKDFQWIVTDGKEGTPPDHTSHLFPYAGQVVMRSGWEREALFLGFEAGPFGYGHQHEDKLGLVIFAYGKDLLVEGGSYAYDASKWRRYVLASEAHNVVLVDGQGQARRGQPRQSYVTDKPLNLAFRSNERYDYARGVYEEGFGKRDQRPARHTREVLFLKRSVSSLSEPWNRSTGNRITRPVAPGQLCGCGSERGSLSATGVMPLVAFVRRAEVLVKGQETPTVRAGYRWATAFAVSGPFQLLSTNVMRQSLSGC
jgi:hypothetical protein